MKVNLDFLYEENNKADLILSDFTNPTLTKAQLMNIHFKATWSNRLMLI